MRQATGRSGVRGGGSDARGFTVLELLFVLVLITLTATASISAFFSRADVTLDNASRVLVDDLLFAQSRAALLGSEVVVVFAADGGGYHVMEPNRRFAGSAWFEDRGRRYDADAVFEGVRVQAVRMSNPRRVLFNAQGEALESGSILLTYHDDVRSIRVERGRGFVYIVEPPLSRPGGDR